VRRLKDIENHLERFDVSFERLLKIEAIREKNTACRALIRLYAGIVAILCAVYAIFMQF
jgi:hypothetical protein